MGVPRGVGRAEQAHARRLDGQARAVRRSEVDALNLVSVARALVFPGRWILAEDESLPAIAKRFSALGIENAGEERACTGRCSSRRRASPTHQRRDPLRRDHPAERRLTNAVELLSPAGDLPASRSTRARNRSPARRGKWSPRASTGFASGWRSTGAGRALREVARGDHIGHEHSERPSALRRTPRAGRYAALVPGGRPGPIVEPEVLMDGDHTIERCRRPPRPRCSTVFDRPRHHRVRAGGRAAEDEHGAPAARAARVRPSVRRGGGGDVRSLRRAVRAGGAGRRVPVGGTGRRSGHRLTSNAMNVAGWARTRGR